MPLVKVNLLKGRSAEEKDSIAASIQSALDHYGHRRSTPRTTRGRDVLD